MKSFIAALRSLVLPFGALSGARIILDGVNGKIQVYNSSNTLVIDISPTGIHIQGATRQWDINATNGFLARRFPDDGTKSQIFDAGLFVTPQTPTPVNGATVNSPGQVYAGNTGGPDEAPFVNMVSPQYTGSPGTAGFYAQSQSDLSGTDNSLAIITGNRIEFHAPTVVPTTDNALQDSRNHYYLRGENGAFIQPVTAGNSFFLDHVTFTHTFANPPCVMTNIQDGGGNTKTWISRAINVTATGFDFFFYQPAGTGAAGASSATLTWTATEYTP